MRIAFTNTLFNLAKSNKKIILLTADLGYSVFEDFEKRFPKQFLNVGISEQNMTGIAAGMAMEGFIPVIYSIVPFSTMRNFEQIRNDICYQNLNVKIIGVGAGYSYGPYGHTHHGLEDMGILRTLPNLSIFAPGDPVETEAVTQEALNINGPVYIRLGRAGEPLVHAKKVTFKKGSSFEINKGSDVQIFAVSTMLKQAVDLVGILSDKGISAGLTSMPSIKPLDEKSIKSSSVGKKLLVSIEEHFIIGGLGSAIAEFISGGDVAVPLYRVGVNDIFLKQIGGQEYMRQAAGISNEQIVKKILLKIK